MKILLAVLLLTSCCSAPAPAPKVGAPDPINCAAACSHLQELGCEEGKPLDDGTTCTAFCDDSQTSGHALNASCVMTIKTCAEVNSKCGS